MARENSISRMKMFSFSKAFEKYESEDKGVCISEIRRLSDLYTIVYVFEHSIKTQGM